MASNYDESKANPYPDLPDPLTLKNGKKVKTAKEWWQQRRPEIVEFFDREIYGRVPKNLPKVKWEVTSTPHGTNGDVPVVTKATRGPRGQFLVPANHGRHPTDADHAGQRGGTRARDAAIRRRPRRRRDQRRGAAGRRGPRAQRQQLILAKGWGYASLSASSIQADNGAGLTQGIIGLVNKGQPRKAGRLGHVARLGLGRQPRAGLF